MFRSSTFPFTAHEQEAIFWMSIDLFSLYGLFSHFRPRDAALENSSFQVSSYARANVRIICEKTKGTFP